MRPSSNGWAESRRIDPERSPIPPIRCPQALGITRYPGDVVFALSVGSVVWFALGLVLMIVLWRTGMAMLQALSAPPVAPRPNRASSAR